MQYQNSDQVATHCSESQFVALIPFVEEASGDRLPPLSSYQEHFQAQRGKDCDTYEDRRQFLPCEISETGSRRQVKVCCSCLFVGIEIRCIGGEGIYVLITTLLTQMLYWAKPFFVNGKTLF